MTEDEYVYFYLGQFIQNMAHAARIALVPLPAGTSMGGPAPGSDAHNLLLQTRQLLIDWPIGVGPDEAGQQVKGLLVGGLADMTIVPMDSRRLRALARDALSQTEFWYDPTAPDGLSEYFPGKSLNRDTL